MAYTNTGANTLLYANANLSFTSGTYVVGGLSSGTSSYTTLQAVRVGSDLTYLVL